MSEQRGPGPEPGPGPDPARWAPEEWQRVEALLDAALDLESERRPAYLERACEGEPSLRRAVESLLARRSALEGFLEELPMGGTGEPEEEEEPAAGEFERRILGSYRIVREIARGGMGWVFLAERADGLFDQQVALKVLRPSFEEAEAARRFEAERRILAGLEHPCVARLIDAGLTAGGRPYLVTEYVDGQSIDVYCRERDLSVEDRLALFSQVGEAVQYAHRNLVVHRDLKPSNILVTADGRVRLLDFGIAKLLDEARDPDAALLTGPGMRWMTPGYAAPEQVAGEAITTATDIYQLGALLYELLAGRRLFEGEGANLRRLGQAITHVDPVPPSGAVREGPASGIARKLRGDLDAIVLKALRKRPDDRYPSAGALVDDLERHLRGVPVTVREGTLRYRTGRFIRRHRIETASASLVLLAVLAGAGTAIWQAGEARRERDQAQEARTETELALGQTREVTEILLDLIQTSDPREIGLTDPQAVREIFREGMARVATLEGHPTVQAGLLEALARVHLSHGDMADAQITAERALELRRAEMGDDHPGAAESLNVLALVRRAQGRYREAEAFHREALALQLRHLGERHLDVARTLSLLAAHIGAVEPAESEDLVLRALEIRRSALGPLDPLVATSLMDLGRMRRTQGNPDGAEAAYREALEIRSETLGSDHPQVARSMIFLADLLWEFRSDADGAEVLYRSGLEIQRNTLGEDHTLLSHATGGLARILSDRGDHAGAEELLREGVERRRRADGPRHRSVAEGLGQLGGELWRQGRHREAEAVHRESLELWQSAVGPDHWGVSSALVGLGEVLTDQGRFDEAEALFHRALEIRSSSFGESHGGVALAHASLARLHAHRGELSEAETLYARALELLLETRSPLHPHVRRLRRELADLHSREEWTPGFDDDPIR